MTISLSSSGGSGGGGDDGNSDNGNGNRPNGNGPNRNGPNGNGTGNVNHDGNGNFASGSNSNGNGSGSSSNSNGNAGNGNRYAGNGGRRVLAAKSDSISNVINNRRVTSYNDDVGLYVPLSGIVKVIRPPPRVLNVKRRLFGASDPEERKAWLVRQLNAITEAHSKIWNFDFVNQRPMESSPSDRYSWERVVVPPSSVLELPGIAAAEASVNSGPEDSSQEEDSSPEEDGNAEAGSKDADKKQKQMKVTDYMAKTKKRSSNAAGFSGKEDEATASKKGRQSVAPTTMTTI